MVVYNNVFLPEGFTCEGKCDCREEYQSGYTVGYNSGLTDGFEEGYDSGYTDGHAEYEEGYESGFTEGYASGSTDGYESGVTNGFSSGYTSGSTDGYNSGYTGGYNSGVTDGYNSGYTSGKTDGIIEQKEKLAFTAITESGTYFRNDGWSAVTVTISGYTQEDLDNAYASGLTIGYESGWSAGYESGYTDALGGLDVPLTFRIVSAGTIVWKINDNSATPKIIEYKKNDGEWTSLVPSTAGASFDVNVGDKVQFRGNNNTFSLSFGNFNSFCGSTAYFNTYGNLMSLIYGDNFATATTLPNNYQNFGLFKNTNVVDAGKLFLPATALTYECYRDMFMDCLSLTRAPELPATTLAELCYWNMFWNCRNLHYIKCLATDISAMLCTSTWVALVASTGTFVKDANMTDWSTGNSGIPENWTVVDA